MENPTKLDVISRRNFISITFSATVGCLLLNNCTYSTASPWRFFTKNEAQLLDALVEQIIPSDEWPGAKDAGVTNYIDKQLIGALSRFRFDYRRGLAAVQESSKRMYNIQFEQIEWDKQTQMLEKMEAGSLTGDEWVDGFDRRFFNLLRDHTMQGFYGSPRHGGNKNYVSYKMIGLDYPHIIGRNKHIAL